MFERKVNKVDTDYEQLYTYLNKSNYRFINSALEYYQLALKGYVGYCFNQDKSFIISVICTVSESVNEIKFQEQMEFAENLYRMLDVEDESDKVNYLGNLRVCLNNPTLIRNFKKYWDIYLLFENKLIVSQVIKYLSENEDYEDIILKYIKRARMYYVDEMAFYSAILTFIEEITISDDTYDTFNSQLEEDKQNAGVYGDLVQRVKKLEKRCR